MDFVQYLLGQGIQLRDQPRVAFILAAPGRKGNGQQAAGLIEFVDIYPTLCELAGLSLTAACIHSRVTGKDNFLNVARKLGDYLLQGV